MEQMPHPPYATRNAARRRDFLSSAVDGASTKASGRMGVGVLKWSFVDDGSQHRKFTTACNMRHLTPHANLMFGAGYVSVANGNNTKSLPIKISNANNTKLIQLVSANKNGTKIHIERNLRTTDEKFEWNNPWHPNYWYNTRRTRNIWQLNLHGSVGGWTMKNNMRPGPRTSNPNFAVDWLEKTDTSAMSAGVDGCLEQYKNISKWFLITKRMTQRNDEIYYIIIGIYNKYFVFPMK